MEILNDTPFQVTSTIFRTEAKSPILSLIAKATFELLPNEACRALPAEEQVPPLDAVYHQDDHGNSLRTDAEVVPFKPRADCLFLGNCYAPGGQPAPAVAVVFSVGSMRKTLWLYGNRHWVDGAFSKQTSSDPEPFLSIPIRNEFAHGGLSSQYNKHGIGLVGPADGEPGAAKAPLANVQNHHKTHEAPNEDCVPAGLGPLDPTFLPRRALGGTYDEEWIYRRKPLPPKDFDFAYFNGARPDQQIEGYLRGDEPLYLQNLHPEHPHLHARLPGIRVRCFLLLHIVEKDTQRLELLEAASNLDTCLVDMEQGTVSLTWRARAPLDPTERQRYTFALIVQEPLNEPRSETHYRARMKSLIFDKLGIAKEPPPPKPSEADVAKEREQAAKAVNTKMVDMFEKGDAPPEMIEIVKQNADPMQALEKLINYVKKLVDDLPKPPK